MLSPPWFQNCGGERPRRSDASVIQTSILEHWLARKPRYKTAVAPLMWGILCMLQLRVPAPGRHRRAVSYLRLLSKLKYC